MYHRTDGDLAFVDFEMHKRDLMREAKTERLTREIEEKPSQVRRGWMRLISDLMDSAMKVKQRTGTAELSNSATLIDSSNNGLEIPYDLSLPKN